MDTIETLKEKLEKKDKAIAMLYKYVNRAESERDQLKKSFIVLSILKEKYQPMQ